MKWVEIAEKVLIDFEKENKIPFKFERFDCELSQLPDTYIVYFLVSDRPVAHYDNKEASHEVRMQISLYYRDNSEILALPDRIIKAFTGAGFKRSGDGRIPYQKSTGHYGWRCDLNFYEKRGNLNG